MNSFGSIIRPLLKQGAKLKLFKAVLPAKRRYFPSTGAVSLNEFSDTGNVLLKTRLRTLRIAFLKKPITAFNIVIGVHDGAGICHS